MAHIASLEHLWQCTFLWLTWLCFSSTVSFLEADTKSCSVLGLFGLLINFFFFKSCYATQSGLQLVILLPQPPNGWVYSYVFTYLDSGLLLCEYSLLSPWIWNQQSQEWLCFRSFILREMQLEYRASLGISKPQTYRSSVWGQEWVEFSLHHESVKCLFMTSI